jgi:hypothetical protein
MRCLRCLAAFASCALAFAALPAIADAATSLQAGLLLQEQPSPQPEPESVGTPTQATTSAYAARFGVSEATAQNRLEVQGRGRKLIKWEAAALGKGFGGLWFDNEDGKFYVGVAPGGELAAAQQVATETDMTEDIVYQDVHSSLEEVEAANATVDHELQSLETDHEATVGTNVSADAVEVYLSTTMDQSDREFVEQVAKAAPAKTIIVEKPPTDFASHLMTCEIRYDGVNGSNDTFCNKPLRTAAGMDDNTTGTQCSIAGVVGGGSGTWVVTAGHCLKGEKENWRFGDWWSTVDASTQERHNIGIAEKAVFGSNGDYGLIRESESDYWFEPYKWYANIEQQTATYVVEQAIESYEGMYQCWAGAQSTVHNHLSCSTVVRVNVNDGLSEHMDESYGPPEGNGHELCLYHGDSGGAVLTDNNLDGIISAGYICGESGPYIAWYAPAPRLEEYYGVGFIDNIY